MLNWRTPPILLILALALFATGCGGGESSSDSGCSPACSQGYVCQNGQCVDQSSAGSCTPACRSGHTCQNGKCVSGGGGSGTGGAGSGSGGSGSGAGSGSGGGSGTSGSGTGGNNPPPVEVCDQKDNDGDGQTDEATSPVIDMAAARLHVCGLTADGRAFCWGNNSWGNVGVKDIKSDTIYPGQIMSSLNHGAVRFKEISAGTSHNCGLTPGGDAYCWGRNKDGELGGGYTGRIATHGTPAAIKVDFKGKFVDVDANLIGHSSCGVSTKGQVYCWGGQMAAKYKYDVDGKKKIPADHPYPIPTPVKFDEFKGDAMWCGTSPKGKLYCNWTLPPQWFEYFGKMTVKDFDVGGHACALREDGVAFCWGQNDWGSLGNGSKEEHKFYKKPQKVATKLKFAKIATGDNHTCALTAKGKAYCWGLNTEGQLGNGDARDFTDDDFVYWIKPIPVKTNLRFKSIGAGKSMTCAVAMDDQLYCWGINWYGQLGGKYKDRHSALPVETGCFRPRK